jgi:hypothetical protein
MGLASGSGCSGPVRFNGVQRANGGDQTIPRHRLLRKRFGDGMGNPIRIAPTPSPMRDRMGLRRGAVGEMGLMRKWIHSMGLRAVAGATANGGWGLLCRATRSAPKSRRGWVTSRPSTPRRDPLGECGETRRLARNGSAGLCGTRGAPRGTKRSHAAFLMRTTHARNTRFKHFANLLRTQPQAQPRAQRRMGGAKRFRRTTLLLPPRRRDAARSGQVPRHGWKGPRCRRLACASHAPRTPWTASGRG